ncbi:coiled-coil domain-containing protein 186-like [Leguminivora glycinivorella]|uniref:coiled-coil domain-containing protein 186-like n=1 Tax=Leguminivora glycinivorella TaxID=1035111 RepID=UPI00200C86A8|nr:coiled-coil domain-containing protein 186-like [Leguminivora glycinivorella]
MNMKSRRLDSPRNPPSHPMSADGNVTGIGEDKQKERGKSRIPQMTFTEPTYHRSSPKKNADRQKYETGRPRSATTRLPPTHPTLLMQDMRQNRIVKDKPALKRPPNISKTSAPFHPPTPVINVPMSLSPESRVSDDEAMFSSEDRKRMQLKLRWQENIAKFETVKRQLHEKQRDLLQLYATLRASHRELLSMGQTMCLPPSEDLSIMNVSKLAPGQLLQLCAGAEINELRMTNNVPFDMHKLREIPNKIVASCEVTLNSRKDIIDWFEDIIAKKMITKNVLIKKIKDFKAENEEFKKSLDKHKEDYLRFINESEKYFKHGANATISNELCFQTLSLKLSEVNTLNDGLRKRLQEAENKAKFCENKSKELEKQLIKGEKHKKRDLQCKLKEEEIVQLNLALEEANSKSRTLEQTVCQLCEENKEMRSNYDTRLKKLNESIDINAKLFDEITADRSKLLTEKQELEKQLLEIKNNFDETLRSTKHESNACVVKLMEAEKKYKELLDEKSTMADKIESMCGQLLESETRFKEVSDKLKEAESNSRHVVEYRKELELLNRQAANTKEELLEYKNTIAKQSDAIQQLRQNVNDVVNSREQLKNDLNNKEKYILELKVYEMPSKNDF